VKHPLSFGPVLLAAGVMASIPALASTQIGVTSAVVPAARGTPTGAEPRVLQVGLDMQANERVQTDAEGKAHLLFLDGSALSIGPNSDVVLDEYVYDPVAKTGKIALSASRGVFRLVGGAISKTTPVSLRTPTATIGVRGGIAMASVGETTSAAFLFGEDMTVTGPGGSSQTANRAGFEITTNPNGTVNPPLPISERTLAGFSAMEGGGGQGSSGGPEVSDSDVSNSQVSALNSDSGANLVAAPGGGPAPGATPPFGEVAEASQQQAVNQSAAMGGDEGSQTPGGGGGGDSPDAPGGEQPSTGLTLANVFVGRAKHATDAATGTDDNSPGGNVGLTGQPGVTNGLFDAQATAGGRLTVNVEADGFEAASSAQPFGSGMLSGVGFLVPSQDFVLYSLVDAADGHRVLAFAGTPTPAAQVPTTGVWRYVVQDDFVRGVTLPFVTDPTNGLVSLTDAYVAWDRSAPGAQRAFSAGAVAIVGQGASQMSAFSAFFGDVNDDASGAPFLSGRMRGQVRSGSSGASDRLEFFRSAFASSDASDGTDFFGLAGPQHFVLEAAAVDANDVVTGRGGERFVPGLSTAAYFPNNPAIAGGPAAPASRSTRTLNGFANALDLRYDAGGNFLGTQRFGTLGLPSDLTISTDAGLNTVAASFALDASVDEASVNIPFGGSGGADSAFIDDRRFVSATDTVTVSAQSVLGEITMVTSSALQHDGLLPGGVAFCDCEYLTWGFFAGRRLRSNATQHERHVELGTWVAGELSNVNQLVGVAPQTATYAGHVMAGVNNNGAIYQAVGAISLNFTFGPGNFALNSVSITNFDGTNLAGVNSAGPQFGTNAYNSGSFTIGGVHPTAGNITANVKGAFFGPGAPPIDTGGSVDFNGTSYTGYGTFAATQPPS